MMTPAETILKKLMQQNIMGTQGDITFDFLGVSINIKEKSAFGDLFQEWLAQWLTQQEIFFDTPDDTQAYPDFFLNPTSKKENLLEIKTFNYNASPAFDIANFEAYCESLETQAYRLDSDYCIFAYQITDGGFIIRDLWLKKVWEIAGIPSKYPDDTAYPITLQLKRNIIYNIRPFAWYSNRAKCTKFKSRREFVEALQIALRAYPKTQNFNDSWFNKVQESYLAHTGKSL